MRLDGKSSKMWVEATHLKRFYPLKKVTLSGEDVGREHFGWKFEPPGLSSLPVTMRSLMATGIPKLLQTYQTELDYKERRNFTRMKLEMARTPYTSQLSGSIQTIFILWCGLLGVTVLTYFSERVWSRWVLNINCGAEIGRNTE